jgi:hypothetical protein
MPSVDAGPQVHTALCDGLFELPRCCAGVTPRHLPPRSGTELRRCGHPTGRPAQQPGLDLRAHRRVLDGRDLLQHRVEVPRVQRPGLQRRERSREAVHQRQGTGQQGLGCLGADRQGDHQLRRRPLAHFEQDLRPAHPSIRAHRPRLALGTVRRSGARRSKGRDRPGTQRCLSGDLPIRGLNGTQRTDGEGDRRHVLRPLGRPVGRATPRRPRAVGDVVPVRSPLHGRHCSIICSMGGAGNLNMRTSAGCRPQAMPGRRAAYWQKDLHARCCATPSPPKGPAAGGNGARGQGGVLRAAGLHPRPSPATAVRPDPGGGGFDPQTAVACGRRPARRRSDGRLVRPGRREARCGRRQ